MPTATYPGDYWLNTELGLALLEGTRSGLGVTNSFLTIRGFPDPRYQRAEPYFMAAVALRPRFGSAHLLLATAELNVGKWDETFLELREALRLQPDDPTIHNCLGMALYAQGKPDEAAAAFREAIRLSPRYNLAYENLGDLLLNRGKPDEAVALFRDMVRLLPEYAPAHAQLARSLAALRRLDESVAEYREAIRIAPLYAIARGNLGLVLRQRGEFAEATAVSFARPSSCTSTPSGRRTSARNWRRPSGRPPSRRGSSPSSAARITPRMPPRSLEFAYLAHEQQRFAGASRLFDRRSRSSPSWPRTATARIDTTPPAPRRWPPPARAGTSPRSTKPPGPGCDAMPTSGSRPTSPDWRPSGMASPWKKTSSSKRSPTGKSTPTWPASARPKPWLNSPSPIATTGRPSGPRSIPCSSHKIHEQDREDSGQEGKLLPIMRRSVGSRCSR